MNKIEILSPAGGADSITAAIRSGADAVYVGATDFSARASAKNFDTNELRDAVRYCHVAGAKVYLALNTLVFDDEISQALSVVKKAAQCDVDAIIVQDIGLAMAIKEAVPDMRLHASTQMSVHSLSGAKALYELGFDRVVLSREMSKSEIKEITDNCPIETEVFVHGALCMCVSGQCYLSAMLGSRSANRGKCAQPCRLPFESGASDHVLSLKDNSIIGYIRELEEIGVTSAKIEGRMKRPEYVAVATSACKQMRDCGAVDSSTMQKLSAVFSRTGFTDGYYTAHRNANMFGYRKKEDVTAVNEKMLKEIRNTYKDELPRVDVDFCIKIALNKKIILTAFDGSNTVTVQSQNPTTTAKTESANKEKISRQLTKTGNTPYKVRHIDCCIEDNCFVPARDINELRRTALDELSKLREKQHDYVTNDIIMTQTSLSPHISASQKNKVSVRAKVNNLEIPDTFKSMELVYVPLFKCLSNLDDVKKLVDSGINIAVQIPRGMFGIEQKIISAMIKIRSIGITDVLCNNLGAVYLAKQLGFVVHGGAFLNITNSLSLKWAKQYGISDVELSIELDADRIGSIKSSIKTGVISYGHLPLMLCRNCPVRAGGTDCDSCKKHSKLQDRKGEQFPVNCDGITTELLNCVPLILPQKIYNLQNINFTTLYFTVENSVENKEKTLKNFSKNQKPERFTHGLYIRGVK